MQEFSYNIILKNTNKFNKSIIFKAENKFRIVINNAKFITNNCIFHYNKYIKLFSLFMKVMF